MTFNPGVSKEALGHRSTDSSQTPTPESTYQGETVIFDGVGTPDYGALAREAKFLNRHKAASDPAKAEFYIPKGFMDYPVGFQEPAPFAIKGSEQWDTYMARRNRIEARWKNREEEELTGVPTF